MESREPPEYATVILPLSWLLGLRYGYGALSSKVNNKSRDALG
jgi:hypothetical protein